MKILLILSIISLAISAVEYTYYPKCKQSYLSFVEALKSINVDSSFSNRKKIATLNGILYYKDTNSQNIILLKRLKKGVLIKSIKRGLSSDSSITYYIACKSTYSSLVDALNSIGVDSSYSNRKKIAALNGISNYTGTANQNNSLLSLLKTGKLIKSKSSSSSSSSGSSSTSTTTTTKTTTSTMINRIKSNTSLGLTTKKKNALVNMGTVLLDDGYEPSFVAGILANIVAEGEIGIFEISKNTKYQYLKYMNTNYNYLSKYSGKCITDVSLSELNKLMQKLEKDQWQKGKFGLGCIQWTGSRTYNLVKLYIQYANKKDKITIDQAAQAEAKMIETELKSSSYKNIYTNWSKNNKSSLQSENAAYNAASDICIKYEVPAQKESKAVTRGNVAKKIYKVMMGK